MDLLCFLMLALRRDEDSFEAKEKDILLKSLLLASILVFSEAHWLLFTF